MFAHSRRAPASLLAALLLAGCRSDRSADVDDPIRVVGRFDGATCDFRVGGQDAGSRSGAGDSVMVSQDDADYAGRPDSLGLKSIVCGEALVSFLAREGNWPSKVELPVTSAELPHVDSATVYLGHAGIAAPTRSEAPLGVALLGYAGRVRLDSVRLGSGRAPDAAWGSVDVLARRRPRGP